jgi:hypothetical protein
MSALLGFIRAVLASCADQQTLDAGWPAPASESHRLPAFSFGFGNELGVGQAIDKLFDNDPT